MKDKYLLSSIVVVCVAIGMFGLWAVDIGVSGEILRLQGIKINAQGFFIREPAIQYHLGLVLITASIISLSLLSLYIIVKL